MTQYNTLNVKLPNSQLNKLKSGIKDGAEVTLNISSNLIGSCNDGTNFPHKLLSANTQVSKICKTFANSSSANIFFLKTHFHKILQSVGFLGRLLGLLLKTRLPLIGNVLKPLSKSVLLPLGLTTEAAVATNATIQKKTYGSGTITLIILNEEMKI